jgi:hypothetical protein
LPDPATARDAEELLDILAELMAFRQSLDWQAGRWLGEGDRLEFPLEAEGDLGISERWAQCLKALDRRLEDRPALREAYRRGRVGWSKTWVLVRICVEETAEVWVAHAGQISLRRLEAEVEAMEAFRDENTAEWLRRTGGLPPSEALLRELAMLPGGHKAADWVALQAAANVQTATDRAREVLGPGWGRANRFRGPPSVAAFFRATLKALQKLLGTRDQGKAVVFLVDYFASVYEEEARVLMRKRRVLERDGYACVFPGCDSRRVEVHHIRYKSQGGEDDEGNLVSLCPAHHRAGQHGGRIEIRGRAPDRLTFRVGRRLWKDDRLVRPC